jgi:hypothetical protein
LAVKAVVPPLQVSLKVIDWPLSIVLVTGDRVGVANAEFTVTVVTAEVVVTGVVALSVMVTQ